MGRVRYGVMLDTKKLREIREVKGLTMAAAAKATGISSAQAWEKIENGDGLSLTLRSLNRISEGLKIPAKELLLPVGAK